MSKYMHIKVTVLPYYQKDPDGVYPKLARYVKTLYSELGDRNPSLYAIAGQLDKILYRFDGTPLREVLLPYKENLRNSST